MKSDLPRAVIDTQVWVFIFERETLHAFESKQPYRAILEALEDGQFAPVFSPATLDELQYLLTKSKAVAQRFNIDVTLAEYFIEAISSVDVGAVVVDIGEPHRVCSDPDDDAFIETAIVGKARYLVSEDGDLHEDAVKRHLTAHGIRVVYPNQFRKILEVAQKPEPA